MADHRRWGRGRERERGGGRYRREDYRRDDYHIREDRRRDSYQTRGDYRGRDDNRRYDSYDTYRRYDNRRYDSYYNQREGYDRRRDMHRHREPPPNLPPPSHRPPPPHHPPPSYDSRKRENRDFDASRRATKRARQDPDVSESSDSKAWKMMKAMGYSKGKGLGKNAQGRVEPVIESQQVSRMGVGYAEIAAKMRAELKEIELNEEYGKEKVEIKIEPNWIEDENPIPEKFESWVKIGSPVMHEEKTLVLEREDGSLHCKLCKVKIADSKETLEEKLKEHKESKMYKALLIITSEAYGNLNLQLALLRAKHRFDGIDQRSFWAARSRANPFELLRKEGFQNRAALKMAEIDAITTRLFTKPPKETKNEDEKLLYFADICAGPGGFSEFMFTVHKWRAKGFGFTIRGSNDFNLSKFNQSAPVQSFRAYYGPDDTGDITKTENLRDFLKKVLEETNSEGVDVVMADGGFHVKGQEERQELLSQQLLLCQFVCAMSILRKGGVFVCKMFDNFLPFTVDCIALTAKHFESFCILKPNQSRPANSERYAVFKGFKQMNPKCVEYLFDVNDKINELGFRNEKERVIRILPDSLISETFKKYIVNWNDNNAKRQILALNKLMQFILDKSLPSDNQDKIRQDCREFWGLDTYIKIDRMDGQKIFGRDRLFNRDMGWVEETLRKEELDRKKITLSNVEDVHKDLKNIISDVTKWWAVCVPKRYRRYYLISTPRGCSLYRRGRTERLHRRRVPSRTEGPPLDTILDVVEAPEGTIHVLDVKCLAGETDIAKYSFEERRKTLSLFLDSIRGGGTQLDLQLCTFEKLDKFSSTSNDSKKEVILISASPTPCIGIEFRQSKNEQQGIDENKSLHLIKSAILQLHVTKNSTNEAKENEIKNSMEDAKVTKNGGKEIAEANAMETDQEMNINEAKVKQDDEGKEVVETKEMKEDT